MWERDALWGMEVFLAVTETGSLAAAAKRLGLGPSAVSKQLAKLERRLGVRLLERTTRRLRPTQAGARYAEHAARVVAALRVAEDEVRREDLTVAGALRVSAPIVLGQEVITPIAARFLDQFPQVTLDLELTDRFVDPVSEAVDLAVRVAPSLPGSGLSSQRVADMVWVIVASPSYVARFGMPHQPSDLARHRCLELAHAADRGRWRLTSADGDQEVKVHSQLVSSSLHALYRCALEGLGVVQAPLYLARTDLAAGRLVRVLPTSCSALRSVFLVRPSRGLVPRRVEAFADRLRAEVPGRLAEAGSR